MQGSARIDELRQKFHENPRRYFAPLANEYRKAGDPEQAIAICRAHLAQQPGHMSGHVVYGQALYDAQRIAESRTVFEKALSLDPDNAIVLRQLGDIARQRGETDEAKHWYSRALDANPHDPEVAAYIAELTEPTGSPAAAGEAAEPAESPPAAESPGFERVDSLPAEQSSDAAEETGETTAEEAADAVAKEAIEPVEETAPTFAEESVEPGAVVTDVIADAGTVESAEEETVESGEREAADPPRVEPLEEKGPAPVVPLADVAWRNTPQHEDSPFVTRTMAELYAKQGYRAAALDVYRQLALTNPDDQDILARIEELAGDSPTGMGQPAMEAEPRASQATESEERAGTGLVDWADLSDDPVYAPWSEEVSGEPEPAPVADVRHFTELEISAGDTWDTDTWGAGFSSDEATEADLDRPDAPFGTAAAPPPLETIESLTAASQQVTVADKGEVPAPAEESAEPVAVQDPVGGPEAAKQLVAYSPQAPDDDDLAHYEPKGPTVREFFATLGARRPPSRESAQSFTARAALPSHENAADHPLAANAFADLFPDSTPTEEDTRAAFALSGAISGGPAVATPLSSAPDSEGRIPPAATTPQETGRESEEDIRRFREWLDGLAES